MKIEIRQILQRYRTGTREWYFAFGNVFNNSGVEIGGGFVPSGNLVMKGDITKPYFDDNDSEVIMNPTVEPDFINRGTLATGVIISKGQWS